jgi:hypothetical protein
MQHTYWGAPVEGEVHRNASGHKTQRFIEQFRALNNEEFKVFTGKIMFREWNPCHLNLLDLLLWRGARGLYAIVWWGNVWVNAHFRFEKNVRVTCNVDHCCLTYFIVSYLDMACLFCIILNIYVLSNDKFYIKWVPSLVWIWWTRNKLLL